MDILYSLVVVWQIIIGLQLKPSIFRFLPDALMMEIRCSIIFKKMRTNYFLLALTFTMLSLTHSAIIITSSVPRFYQLNSKQTLIVFDQPSTTSTPTSDPSQNNEAASVQNQTQITSSNVNKNEGVVQDGYTNTQNIGSESMNNFFPNIPIISNPISKSNAPQSSKIQAKTPIASTPSINVNPFITSTNPQPSPSITTTSNPFITDAQSTQKSVPSTQSSVKQVQTISQSRTSTTSITTSSTTIITNYGQVPLSHQINYARLFSSFGGIGNRADQDQYRTLIRQQNRNWIRSQKKLGFKLAQNHFNHLTMDQFRQLYLNLQVPKVVNIVQMDFKKIIQKFFNINDQTFNKWFGNYYSIPKNLPSPSNNTNNSTSNSTSNNSTSKNSTSNSTSNNSTSNNPTNNNSTSNNSTSNNSTSNNSTSNSTSNNSSSNNSTSNNSTSNSTNSTNSTTSNTTNSNSTSNATGNSSILINVDWTLSGVVTSVKDQGSCGGCYAFSANAAIQSAFLINSKSQYSQIDISEQQILDCSSSYGNKGCNGGWLSNVFQYVQAGGIATEAAYPYTQVAGSCKNKTNSFTISSYTGGKLADCNALVAMVTGRPTSIAVAAGNNYWKYYAGGILTQCGTGIDHGVLLVGVFQNSTANYWKVKNSWGSSWGEQGYIRISRDLLAGNLCDICGYGYYPTI